MVLVPNPVTKTSAMTAERIVAELEMTPSGNRASTGNAINAQETRISARATPAAPSG